ncbi:LRC71 protein, partial [Oceanites oceanicus]|nr:LRC71 protein [Oceanites oceanicus]
LMPAWGGVGGVFLRRMLSLEGNPLPEPAFHTLLGSDSTFNRISDLGAGHIAQGLRLNRSLLSLSLANNNIGDAGAVRLAEVLGPFALTHAEVVERRRLLLAETLGCPRSVSEGPTGWGGHRGAMPSSAPSLLSPVLEPRAAHGRDAKPSGQKLSPEVGGRRGGRGGDGGAQLRDPTLPPCIQAPDPAEPPHPLLEDARQEQGSVVLPGNRALLNLNLTRERGRVGGSSPPATACHRSPSPSADNHITERGLGAFLAALEEQQREKKPKVPGQQGLLRLSLERNCIPPTSPALAQLQELLPPQDPLPKAQGQEEEQDLGT